MPPISSGVKVVVRVRPKAKQESSCTCDFLQVNEDSRTVSIGKSSDQRVPKQFLFDACFGPAVSQVRAMPNVLLHVHTHTHTRVRAHTHTHTHTHRHTLTHTHTHTQTHTHTHTRTHTHTHTHTHAHTHTHTRAHTPTCMHTHKYTLTHTHVLNMCTR